MKKLFKWVKKILFIAFTLLIIVKLASSLTFTFLMGTSYKEYPWKGEWNSNERSYTSGYLMVSIPYALPINQPIKANAIRFDYFYTFEHVFSKEPMSLHGIAFPLQSNSSLNDSLSVGFQANLVGNNGHMIELNGSVNLNRTLITGSYRGISPKDMGTFSLHR